jgi:hypothetical protein
MYRLFTGKSTLVSLPFSLQSPLIEQGFFGPCTQPGGTQGFLQPGTQHGTHFVPAPLLVHIMQPFLSLVAGAALQPGGTQGFGAGLALQPGAQGFSVSPAACAKLKPAKAIRATAVMINFFILVAPFNLLPAP